MNKIIVNKYIPNGEVIEEKYFSFEGGCLRAIENKELETFIYLPSGSKAKAKIPVFHGYIFEFKTIEYGRLKWVLYGKHGRLHLYTEKGDFSLDEIKIEISRIWFYVRMIINGARYTCVIPLHYFLLADPQLGDDFCCPIYGCLKFLQDEKNRVKAAEFWSSGKAALCIPYVKE